MQYQLPATVVKTGAMPGARVLVVSQPMTMDGATYMTGAPYSTYGGCTMSPYMPAVSGLDHSQGKWFAPGQALPPGFVITEPPKGHTAHHPPSNGLDHSQGKWFAPGQALPPGFVITEPPKGHTAHHPPSNGLDHSQGKWFAPGQALPPGFVITEPPKGHTTHHVIVHQVS